MFAYKASRAAAFAVAAAVISGCATQSAGPYSPIQAASTDAIVLVGVDSQVPLSHLSMLCVGILVCSHQLGVTKDVMAFPVPVGNKFGLSTIHAMDGRLARITIEPLTIEQRGIYYYGTIFSTGLSAGVRPGPDKRMLLGAKRKFGSRYDGYTAVNFSWPDPSEDRLLGLGYRNSEKTQAALRSAPARPVRLVSVAAPKDFDPSCRMASSAISLPDFLPYEEWVRRAFNQELEAAGLFAGSDGGTVLTGALTELAFSTSNPSFWKIGLRLATADGRSATASTTSEFPWSPSPATACPMAEGYFRTAVTQLLEALAQSAEFRALLSEAGK